MLVREKRDPLVRRPPIRMGIGVLLFNLPSSFRLDSADGESVSLSASSTGDAASRNVVSGEKESLGSDGNASVVSDSSSGADLAD